jgi:hypothetical protein
MARQNFLHTIRFLQWLVLNRPTKYDEAQVSELSHNFVDGGNARKHLDSADTDV